MVGLQESSNDGQTKESGNAELGSTAGRHRLGGASWEYGLSGNGNATSRSRTSRDRARIGGDGIGGDGNMLSHGAVHVASAGASVADNRAGGDDGLCNGARAVSDGDGRRLSDSPGGRTMGDSGGRRAVGDIRLDDLGDNGHVAGVGNGASGGSENGDSGELHFDGIKS